MVQLRVCEQCERHVHVGEQVCPFCQAALAAQPLDLRRKTAGNLSRAQRFAAAMSMAAAPLVACSETTTAPADGGMSSNSGGQTATGGELGGTGGFQETGGQMAQPVYGAPFPTGGEVAIPPYGISPFPTGGFQETGGTDIDASAPNDGGVDGGTDGAVDAGEDAGPVIVPLYGIPPYGIPPTP